MSTTSNDAKLQNDLDQTVAKILEELDKYPAELFDALYALSRCKRGGVRAHEGNYVVYTLQTKDYILPDNAMSYDYRPINVIDREADEMFYGLYTKVMAGDTTKEAAIEIIMYTILQTYLSMYVNRDSREQANIELCCKLSACVESKSWISRRTRNKRYFVFFQPAYADTEYKLRKDTAFNKYGDRFLYDYLAYVVVYFFTQYKFCIFTEFDETSDERAQRIRNSTVYR